MKALRIAVITLYTFVGVLPLLWLVLTAFKYHPDTITASAKFIPIPGVAPGGEGLSFAPTIEGFAHLAETTAGTEFSFLDHLLNSTVIGVMSTLASVGATV